MLPEYKFSFIPEHPAPAPYQKAILLQRGWAARDAGRRIEDVIKAAADELGVRLADKELAALVRLASA